jgi:CBS domain-containing protein
MLVEEVMTSDVATVDVEASLREAVGVMLRRGVGSVVVVTGSPPRKTGIVTDTDVKRAAYESDAALSSLAVGEWMSSPLVTVRPDVSLSTAVETMSSEGVKHLVVTEKMELVGVVTASDVASAHDEVVSEVRRIDSRKSDWDD